MNSNANVARMATAVVACACAYVTSANAENATPTYIGMTAQDVGVMDRARPAYDAKGIPLGGFRLFPTFTANAAYDDNVFKTNSPVSDWVFTQSPEVRLSSQWGRHAFEIYGGSNTYEYAQYTGANLTDWRAGADGKLDISRSANVSANASYGQEHEAWNSPNVAGFQSAPNRYWLSHVDTAAVYQPNRLGFGIGGVFDHYNWTKTPKNGGGFLYNDDRDQSEYQAYAKVYYDFSPGYSGYVKASYDERDFDSYFDRSGLHRSSHGYHIDSGLNLQISHLVSGEIYIGYLNQNFASKALSDVSGFDFGAKLDWYISPVLTAHLSGGRTLSDVVLSGVSASDNKNVAASVDYELRENIILQGRVSYTNSKYVGSSRTDDLPSAGFGVKYLFNRYASLDFNYNYSERSTATAAAEYTDNTVSIGLNLHI